MNSSNTLIGWLLRGWLCALPVFAQAQDAGRIYISPPHENLNWEAPAPVVKDLPLREALQILLPQALAVLPLTLAHTPDPHSVSVPQGLTRREALSLLVPTGAVLLVFDHSVVLASGRLLTAPPRPVAHSPTGAVSAPSAGTGSLPFQVTPADRTLRGALERWSRQAGWTFESAFWTLARDLPIQASGHFGSDYKAAVFALLKSSDTTDIPAKPCFYSNRVLRVVVRTEACSRTESTP